ncbi:hypothetical protein DASC09_042270 [Saccharomycopsis crataegensis]|uniref:Uncharacterized protein n=1 Tax=Saccharomycopsis crataegensis TaxID=43959 RepID=A0AAV5QQL9_9ASCO|nr:hypothetical protein DASC09_042270 [Saccharomycopsis crataegensis]
MPRSDLDNQRYFFSSFIMLGILVRDRVSNVELSKITRSIKKIIRVSKLPVDIYVSMTMNNISPSIIEAISRNLSSRYLLNSQHKALSISQHKVSSTIWTW